MSRYVEVTGSFGSKETCVFTGRQYLRQNISKLPVVSFRSNKFVELIHHFRRIVFGDGIDGEHTGGISYAQYLLAGYLPVDKTCKGGQVIDGWNVLFIIQDGLVEVGDAPTQRDVVDK